MWIYGSLLLVLCIVTSSHAACPSGWNNVGPDIMCYGIVTSAPGFKNSYEARQACLQTGGDLVRVIDSNAKTAVHNLMSGKTSSDTFYVGVSDIQTAGTFKYLTSTASVAFTVGSVAGGSGNCVIMKATDWAVASTSSWERAQCCANLNMVFAVCEKEFATTTTVSMQDDILAEKCYVYKPCLSNPCQNTGVCTYSDSTNTSYTCICPQGTTGTNCETNADDCATVTCLNGGTCIDGINEHTCACVAGFTGASCESDVRCPVVTATSYSNATKTGGPANENPGATFSLTCLSGYMFDDMTTTKTLTCDESGQWLPDVLGCSRHCSGIPTIVNAEPVNPSSVVGHVLNYTCILGYIFPDNTTLMNITCMDNGNWSIPEKNLPKCEIVKCPVLPDYPHQTVNTQNNVYNTTVIFWCDVGFSLSDNTTARTIRCTHTGDWTAKLPPCDPVKCPKIASIAHGTRNTTDNTYNTYAEYKCEAGYRMYDGAAWRIVKCDATGEWSDNITDCALNRCYPLPYVANATPSTLAAEFNTEVTFTCIQGHKFYLPTSRANSQSIKCLSDNGKLRWNPNLKSCEPVQCPILKDEITTQGLIHVKPDSDARLYGSIVDLRCDKGHYYVDNTSAITLECLETEQWNVTTYQDCFPVKCTQPPATDGGTAKQDMYGKTAFQYEDLVYYECQVDHKFLDGRTMRNIVCNEFGHWNESDLSCRKDRCDPVPYADNVKPNSTETNWYTVVKYTCNEGYEWTDGTKQTILDCTNLGTWNNKAALKPCTAKVCPALLTVSNSQHNGTKSSTSYVYGDYVEFFCNQGYKYDDNTKSKVANCNSMGKWSPDKINSCNAIECEELDPIENATLMTNSTKYGIDIVYQCEEGYQFPDKDRQKTVRCMAGVNDTEGYYQWFKFKSNLPEKQGNFCEVVFCPPVPKWTETDYNSTDNGFGSAVYYSCRVNHSFEICNKDKDNYQACLMAKKTITTITEKRLVMSKVQNSNDTEPTTVVKWEDVTVEVATSVCDESKQWLPAFLDCVLTTSLADGVNAIPPSESKDGPKMGIFAITLLLVTVATIILLDVTKLYSDIKLMKANIQYFMNKRKKNKVSDSSTSIPNESTA